MKNSSKNGYEENAEMNDKKILITGFSGFVARHFVEYYK